MLRIWGRASSSNVQKVLWLAREIDLPFERIDAGGPYGVVNEPAYRALNPNGLVPTIDDDGFVLWESNTICRYLAAKHQAHAMYPTALRERADVERWMDWASTALGPALFPAFWGLVRTPEAQRDRAAIVAGAHKTATALAVLDAQLGARAFVAGNALTLADLGAGIHAHRWFNLPFETVGYERPELAHLRAWYERLKARAPYRDVVMTPIV